MRQAIVAYLDRGGEHLSDTARDAVALLREDGAPAPQPAGPVPGDNVAAGATADRAD
jgi:hypothetical protein